ncbi:MAG: 50S ribosomal protein L11 methyltransferase [Leptospiraceae bacterium]|nr:50S ribosomal protein L11 methyltransferase [Leptospiraceae bacterium]MDW7976088.1 50S ribosomal protein L11 methyltransferase [Leptospiraceae bacterium]
MVKYKYWELKIQLSKKDLEKLNDYMETFDLDGALGYYLTTFEEDNSEDPAFTVYYPIHHENPQKELRTLFSKLKIENYKISENPIEEENYWEDYIQSFQPFFVSQNFFLVPIWHKDSISIPENAIPIFIEPGLAFGTGLHPTTQLMLEWIDKNLQEGIVVLDAGCGSGILSIASLKKNAKTVYAFDIDMNAIDATFMNIKHNDPSSELRNRTFLFTSSWDNDELLDKKYDVILANLSLPVFFRYESYIKRYQTNCLVISGIHENQTQEIIDLFSNVYMPTQIQFREEWVLIELKKWQKI